MPYELLASIHMERPGDEVGSGPGVSSGREVSKSATWRPLRDDH